MKKGDCSSPVKALVQIDVNKHAIYENVCYAFFLKEIRISYSIYLFFLSRCAYFSLYICITWQNYRKQKVIGLVTPDK